MRHVTILALISALLFVGEVMSSEDSARAAGWLNRTTDWEAIHVRVRDWEKQPVEFRRELAGDLRKNLGSRAPVKLVNYADMFVLSRLSAGKMPFHGHGWMIRQDVFLQCGLNAWAIERITGAKLPEFEADDSWLDAAAKQLKAEAAIDEVLKELK